jgi:hypothetical protein
MLRALGWINIVTQQGVLVTDKAESICAPHPQYQAWGRKSN